MTTVSANRPLLVANRPQTTVANKPVVAAPVAAKPVADAATAVNTNRISQFPGMAGVETLLKGWAQFGRTTPVFFDIVTSSIKSSISVSNLAWQVIPSAIGNVRNVASGKISAGRAGANVATETTFGIAKGIGSAIAVQSLSIAIGPALGLVPVAILPYAGIAVALGGLVLSYFVMNKLIKATGIDQKMADGLTKLFGGDKAPAPAAVTPAKA